MADIRFYVAYIPDEKNWKFLCRYEKGKGHPIIVADFRPNRRVFLNCHVSNMNYKIREATEREISQVMVNMI